MNDYRADSEMKLAAFEQRKDMEMIVLKQRVNELDQLVRELEANLSAEEKRASNMLGKVKDAHSAAFTALERQLYDSSEAYKRVEAYSK